MNKNDVFFYSNKKLLHVYICCARPNGRTVRHIIYQFDLHIIINSNLFIQVPLAEDVGLKSYKTRHDHDIVIFYPSLGTFKPFVYKQTKWSERKGKTESKTKGPCFLSNDKTCLEIGRVRRGFVLVVAIPRGADTESFCRCGHNLQTR